ncbi:MAG: YciI family protein [Melioribacteraceae bacterium]|nr:YciI family protein [Melioribacteraceae bacterium]
MRKLFFLLASILILNCSNTNEHISKDVASGFDSLKADIYGADEYGMKTYVFAFLKKGPNRDISPSEAAKLQKGHLKNIKRLAKENKLVLAGPFFGDGDIRGIYIFNVDNLDSAKALTETDPAIQAGSLVMELHKWYGTAALMAINEIAPTLAKKSITND